MDGPCSHGEHVVVVRRCPQSQPPYPADPTLGLQPPRLVAAAVLLLVTDLGGTPEEKPEVYAASSPITYVEQVAAPLLIIQGRHDTRTPARPIQVYEQRMRELGKPIEVEWFDAGHGSFVTEQRIEHQELMLRFAYRVLGATVTDAVAS